VVGEPDAIAEESAARERTRGVDRDDSDRAPEPAHAIKGVIDEAIAAREAGQERVILFNLSGHGHFDMQAYDDYLNNRLPEVEFDPAEEESALAELPEVPVG